MRRRIGVQLAFWYSGFFIVGGIALFVFSYMLLFTSLREKDHEFIDAEIHEHANQYNEEGLAAAIREINDESKIDGHDAYLTRIVNQSNVTLYRNVPDKWRGFDIKAWEQKPFRGNSRWEKINLPDDEDVIDVYCQSLNDGNLLQVGRTSKERNDILEQYRNLVAAVLLPLTILGFSVGYFFAGRALKPIQDLTKAAKDIIATGRLQARIPQRNTEDEIDQMAGVFNSMLAKIEAVMKAMTEALDNVAHDLRTPLTRMRNVAESTLQAKDVHADCEAALADCLEESELVITQLKTLMDISEAETGALKLALEPVDINKTIEEVVDLYHYVSEEKSIQVTTSLQPNTHIQADRLRMRQVLSNLLDNALKYTGPGGQVLIQSFNEGQHVRISVQDNGAGIPASDIKRIWDRLFRGDTARTQKGLGLGLSLVRAIVNAHQGKIDVASEPGLGSTFTVFMPAVK